MLPYWHTSRCWMYRAGVCGVKKGVAQQLGCIRENVWGARCEQARCEQGVVYRVCGGVGADTRCVWEHCLDGLRTSGCGDRQLSSDTTTSTCTCIIMCLAH